MKRLLLLICILALLPACGGGGSGLSSSQVDGNFVETTLTLERALVYVLNLGDGSVSAYVAGGTEEEAGHGHAHGRDLGSVPLAQDEHGHGEGGEEEGGAGELEDLDGSPYPLGGTNIVDVVDTPNGFYLFFADRGTNQVRSFVIDGVTGFLQSLEVFSPSVATDLLAMDEEGDFLLVVDAGTNQAALLRISGSGRLTQVGTVTLPATPHQVIMAEDFVIFALADQVAVFTFDRDSGAFALVDTSALPAGTYRGMTLHEEELLFVVEQTTGVISSFGFEEGMLTALSNLALPADQQTPVALEDFEGHLLVANRDSNNISVVTFDEEDGTMAFEESVESQGMAPVDLLLVGEILLVANSGSNQIATFHVEEELEHTEESPFDSGPVPSKIIYLERTESVVVAQPVNG